VALINGSTLTADPPSDQARQSAELPRRFVLGPYSIAPLRLREAILSVLAAARHARAGIVVTPNIHHLLIARRDTSFGHVVSAAQLAVADGWPLVALSRALGRRLPERVAGIDLVEGILESTSGLRLAILGGPPGAAQALAARACRRHEIVLVDPLPAAVWAVPDPTSLDSLKERVASARPNLVLIGIGAPKQELIGAELADAVAGPIVCCGAAIEVIAGLRPRAPRIVQKLRCEWAFRLALEPRRLGGRYASAGVGFAVLSAHEWWRNRASVRDIVSGRHNQVALSPVPEAAPNVPPVEWPKVSAIVATRDRPELLARALDSILGQDYPGDIECVVVFDQVEPHLEPSVINSRRVLKITRNDRTPGLPGARNAGAACATGEFLAFCDDDDEWLPAKLRRQVEFLCAHPEYAAAGCANVVSYQGRNVPRIPSSEIILFGDLLRSRIAVLHSSTIVVRRADFIGRIGPTDEEIPDGGSEDYEWQLRAAKIAPLYIVPEPLARIHWHSGSKFARRWDIYAAGLEYILARYPEFLTERRGLARIAGQIAFARAVRREARESFHWIRRAVAADWREPRAYLALLVLIRLLPPEALLHNLHRVGRGI
jgi:exopolysaccharide biosynthesis WecB/TagA/CpsF family protein